MARPPSDSGPLGWGARVGPYLVESLLGEGGMGAVYLARHTETGARVALKVLRERAVHDPVELGRFQREAELLARIEKHPGLVRVHASGRDGGIAWCAMERVEGESLSDLIRHGPLEPERAARIVAQAARAIAFVHRHGVLHRDLKPGNILVEAGDRARVVDFGLAHDAFGERLTLPDEIIGTPVYMAPEQVTVGAEGAGLDISERTDVYGLGAVLYAALTGRGPFEGSSSRAAMFEVVTRDPKPPRRFAPGVPAELEAICLHAMEKVPEHRYDSARELAADLERWLGGEPVSATSTGHLAGVFRRLRYHGRSKRTLFVAGAALGLAVVVLAVALIGLPAPEPEAPVAVGERLGALEGALAVHAEVDLAEVEALAGRAAALDDPAIARRIDLLRALVRVARDGRQESDVRDLAIALRPGGRLDPVAFERAQRLLLARDDLGGLDVVLHGVEPVVAAAPEVAARLAPFLIGQRRPPPRDAAAFAALHDAKGVAAETKAALLHRRGADAIADGEDGFARGLADWGRALAEHGAPPPADAWTPALAVHCRTALLAELAAGRIASARALLDLLVRAPLAEEDLAPSMVAALQAALDDAAAEIVLGEAGAAALERALIAAGLLELHGLSQMSRASIEKTWGGLGAERILERGEEEVALPPGRLNPAVLIVLARLLQFGQAEVLAERRRLTRPWVEAAAATNPGAPGLLVQVAWLLERMGEPEQALEHARRALQADRARPDASRSPLVAERAADIIADLAVRRAERAEADRGPIATALREAGAIALEAWRVQLAVQPRVERIVAAGGTAPAPLQRRVGIMRQVCDAAEAIVGLGEPHCEAEDGPGALAALLEAAGASEDDLVRARYHRIRAEHEWRHGRPEPAVAALHDAIERLAVYLAATPDTWNFHFRWLHQYRALCADWLRELGERDAALAEVDAAIGWLRSWDDRRRAAVREFDADLAHAHRRRAVLLHELGRGGEAAEDERIWEAFEAAGGR